MPKRSKKRRPNLPIWAKKNASASILYKTENGVVLNADSFELLSSPKAKGLKKSVQLVFTSPPFPLNRKKKYGNFNGKTYKNWLANYAPVLSELLTDTGSIVLEVGNAWEAGKPVMSTLALETLLAFKRKAGLYLCQEFIWFNPAKLPTPAQWVTINRIRVKDAFTRLWWLSKTPYPKADNSRVLVPYSGSMKSLLRTKKYNAGVRPSEHKINATSFLADNGGAIPPNVLQDMHETEAVNNILLGSNTESSDDYHAYCKANNLTPHPARMPLSLAKFFINLCTDKGDVVLDPFGGSNTTGAAADELGRRWVSIEREKAYAEAGMGRFPKLTGATPKRGRKA